MGYLEDWNLTAEDDNFHPKDDNRWYTETVWFAWFVPERKMIGYFYPVFRPNIGTQHGGVMLYDDSGVHEWEQLVYDVDWHQPIPDGLDLRNAVLPNSMTLQCLEPARKFRLGYSGRELQFDLLAEGIMKPLVTAATPPFNKGHIDQICHVTGTMIYKGETIEVDSFAMRDRSWGPREDGKQPTVGYDYATADAQNAFLAVSVSRATDVWDVTTGFLVRDGVWGHIESGRRWVERDRDGHPLVVGYEAIDELGRTTSGRGEVVSLQMVKPYPAMACLDSLMRWEWDGLTGWGEDQDCWHPRRFRDYVQAKRAGSA